MSEWDEPSALRLVARRAGERGARALDALDATGGTAIEAEDRAARAALEVLADAGLLAWSVPADFGGADAGGLCPPSDVSVRALAVLRSELAWHSGMLDVMLVMQGLGSYPLVRGGASELAREHLPAVARGERVAAFALTEPDAGSDLSAIATRARRDGGAWRLDGRKTFISNAGVADLYTVLARTSGAPGDDAKDALSMFLVPADAPGLSVERFEVMAPHPIGDVGLEGVRVPASALIGAQGEGLAIALGTLGRFRTTVAAAANGFARRALDESARRLGERVQFGKPLAANQALRFDLAEMDVRLRAAELLVDEAARAVDEGLDAAHAVARAKLWATETASYVCDRAVQHFGGLGVRRGTIVERLFREVRALRIYEGTSEIQKLLIGRAVLAASAQRLARGQ